MAFEENYCSYITKIILEYYGDKHSIAYFLQQSVVNVSFFHPVRKKDKFLVIQRHRVKTFKHLDDFKFHFQVKVSNCLGGTGKNSPKSVKSLCIQSLVAV